MVSGSTGGTTGEKPRDRRTGLIFLLSLLIAFSIWLLHNLSLPYSVFIEYAVDVNTSMEGRAQRSESSDLLIIRGKADGYYILRQRFGRPKVLNVTVDPSSLVQYPDREDLFHVSCESIKGAIVEALGSNVELEFIVTQSLDFVLPKMEYRRVPIIPKLSLAFRSQYIQVGDISLNPDSIDIYGDARILGAIDSVMTETIAESNIDADLQGIVDIIPIRNVTYSDKNAYYYVRTERYIGESVELPVYAAGLPEGKEMIILPSTVTLTCRRQFSGRDIMPEDFRLEVNYEDYLKSVDFKLIPELVSSPASLLSYEISPKFVDCIVIDTVTETE